APAESAAAGPKGKIVTLDPTAAVAAEVAAGPVVGRGRERLERHAAKRSRHLGETIVTKHVVEADLDDLLAGRGREDRGNTRRNAHDRHEPGGITDVVVLDLGGPVGGDGIFEAGADQQAGQRALAVRNGCVAAGQLDVSGVTIE